MKDKFVSKSKICKQETIVYSSELFQLCEHEKDYFEQNIIQLVLDQNISYLTVLIIIFTDPKKSTNMTLGSTEREVGGRNICLNSPPHHLPPPPLFVSVLSLKNLAIWGYPSYYLFSYNY
jgi:hypothetical protein